MGRSSKIEWTQMTWNPWQGCHKLSAGCKNCYMFREKKRYGQDPDVVVRSKPNTFNLPLRIKEAQLVFACSWSDFFIKEADQWRKEAWEIIRQTPHLAYQILTKRIEHAAEQLPWGDGDPWPNVHLGVSCEDQKALDERVPFLLQTPAAVRWVSLEPLLGPVILDDVGGGGHTSLTTEIDHPEDTRLDWVIVGGESGPGARPMHPDWVRSIRDQCQSAAVPFLFKQWGAWAPDCLCDTKRPHPTIDRPDGKLGVMFRCGKKAAGRELDGRTWDQFPEVKP